MGISDWSSDGCAANLRGAGAALATAFAIASAIAAEAAQTSLEGWAKRAHTETLRVSDEASLRKSARLSTAYLAASPRYPIGKTLGGSKRLAIANHRFG